MSTILSSIVNMIARIHMTLNEHDDIIIYFSVEYTLFI